MLMTETTKVTTTTTKQQQQQQQLQKQRNSVIILTREKRLGSVNRLEYNCQLNIGYHCGRSQRENT